MAIPDDEDRAVRALIEDFDWRMDRLKVPMPPEHRHEFVNTYLLALIAVRLERLAGGK
jgi:hypothetical protein